MKRIGGLPVAESASNNGAARLMAVVPAKVSERNSRRLFMVCSYLFVGGLDLEC